MAFKLATSERFGTGGDVTGFAAGLVRTLVVWDYPPGTSGLNLRAAIAVNFVERTHENTGHLRGW